MTNILSDRDANLSTKQAKRFALIALGLMILLGIPIWLAFVLKSRVLLIAAAALALGCCNANVQEQKFAGSFHANDSGESHGGFEWAGEYSATLTVREKSGDLALTFSIGLGDPLKVHQFTISDFRQTPNDMEFMINGQRARLHFTERDSIWNGQYNHHFTANKSSKPAEQVGELPIKVFDGFGVHYYVELRLKPVEPAQAMSSILEVRSSDGGLR